MQLTFLGTGAASAVPLPFCDCPLCRAARRLRGNDLRARAALLVNDDLMIDFWPDAVPAAQRMGKDLTRVRTLLITHAHGDHFDPGHLVTRVAEYGCQNAPPLLLAASPASLAQLSAWLEREEPGTGLGSEGGRQRMNMTVHAVTAGEAFPAGRYTVTGIYSHHAPDCDSRLYIVQDGDCAVFYATDTPAFGEDTWQALAQTGLQFRCVILDHTYGILPETGTVGRPVRDHMCAADVAEAAAEFRARGLLTPDGQVFATHLSHEDMLPHQEMTAYARAHGYEVAWDGLTLAL